jgi:hypothetical protein
VQKETLKIEVILSGLTEIATGRIYGRLERISSQSEILASGIFFVCISLRARKQFSLCTLSVLDTRKQLMGSVGGVKPFLISLVSTLSN